MNGIALKVAKRYGLADLSGLREVTAALSAAFDQGRAELPPMTILLAPSTWATWEQTFLGDDCDDNDCDDADGDDYEPDDTDCDCDDADMDSDADDDCDDTNNADADCDGMARAA